MKRLTIASALACSAAVSVLAAAAAFTASAQDNQPAAQVQTRPHGSVPLSPTSELGVAEVEIPPGHSSESHSHPATLFAYVLEGEIRSGLNDEAPILYRAGEGWFEPEGTVHSFFENASDTAPARFLVVRVSAPREATPPSGN